MSIKRLKLPETFRNILLSLPESGMGYQTVRVFLRNGDILYNRKILNSELLVLDELESVDPLDIVSIELEYK